MENKYFDYSLLYKEWEESEIFYMDLLNLIFSKEIQRKNLKPEDFQVVSSVLWRYWDLLLKMNPVDADQFKLFEEEFGKKEEIYQINKEHKKLTDIIRIEINITDQNLIKEIACQRVLNHLSKSKYNTFELFKKVHIEAAQKHLVKFSDFYSFHSYRRFYVLTSIWLKALESITREDIEAYTRQGGKKQPAVKIVEHDLNDQEDRWFNLTELVKYLPDSPAKSTIYAKVGARKIPHYKKGKHLSFLQSEIDTWLKDGKVNTHEELRNIADGIISKYKKTK